MFEKIKCFVLRTTQTVKSAVRSAAAAVSAKAAAMAKAVHEYPAVQTASTWVRVKVAGIVGWFRGGSTVAKAVVTSASIVTAICGGMVGAVLSMAAWSVIMKTGYTPSLGVHSLSQVFFYGIGVGVCLIGSPAAIVAALAILGVAFVAHLLGALFGMTRGLGVPVYAMATWLGVMGLAALESTPEGALALWVGAGCMYALALYMDSAYICRHVKWAVELAPVQPVPQI